MDARARILVIDDDDVARAVVEETLASAGFAPVGIASPIGAAQAVRQNGIDAVVCDLNMPAMRGDALARLFRESKSLRSVPLILISGASREELDALIVDGTVDDVVHKSELGTVLILQLRKALARR